MHRLKAMSRAPADPVDLAPPATLALRAGCAQRALKARLRAEFRELTSGGSVLALAG